MSDELPDGLSNPFSTGEGGATFEQLVGALYLVSLLTKDIPRGLDWGITKEVRFQQRWDGALLDDLVIISNNGDNERKLALQIKHKLTFSDAESNTEFKKVIEEAWKTFNSEFGWEFNPDLDRIGIGMGIYKSDIDNHLKVILEWAKTSLSADEFIKKINLKKFSSDKKRSYLGMFKKLLSEVKGSEIEDIELWKFLSSLVIIHFDLEHEGSRDSVECWNRLKSITSNNDPEVSKSIFNSLKSTVSEYARSAGSINLDVLQRKIPELNDVANEFKEKIPEVYIKLKEQGDPCKDGKGIYPVYRLYYVNKGKKPAEQAQCYILIGSDQKINIWQYTFYSAHIEELDPTHYDLDEFIQSYQIKEILHYIYPRKGSIAEKIYPFKECSNSYLAILENDINKIKKIIALTIEDNGFARQEFKVTTEENKKYFKEIKREFNPY